MIQLKVMKNNNSNKLNIILGVMTVLVLVLSIYFSPVANKKFIKKAEAIELSVTKHFGGKITEADYQTGCQDMTDQILEATYGAVYLTVDKIEIGDPNPQASGSWDYGATVGILRLWGVSLVPPLVPIGDFRFYNNIMDI